MNALTRDDGRFQERFAGIPEKRTDLVVVGFVYEPKVSMKTLDQIRMTPSQRQALSELQQRLYGSFGIQAIILFGSFVRGEADEESDIDLLIVTEYSLKRTVRHQITEIVFEVNLKYDTNFSTLVIDRLSWEGGLISILPLRDEILKEGIPL